MYNDFEEDYELFDYPEDDSEDDSEYLSEHQKFILRRLHMDKEKKKLLVKNLELEELEKHFVEYCRFSGAERFFLYLLCGFATTIFLPAPDILTFVLQIIFSFIFAFLVMLSNIFFPKRKGEHFIGDFYEQHPYLYAIIIFIITAAIITVAKFLK